MRKLFALAIACLIGFPLVAPAFASVSESSLPSCCRKDGAHHCGMKSAAGSPQTGAAFAANCPLFRAGALMPAYRAFAAIQPGTVRTAGASRLLILRVQHEARQHISFARSSQRRGPPSLHS